jgi:hypothetical protein
MRRSSKDCCANNFIICMSIVRRVISGDERRQTRAFMDSSKAIPTGFSWPDEWIPLPEDEGKVLEQELRRELPAGHVLQMLRTRAIARRRRIDDVVFATSDSQHPVAVVHLTWKGGVEFDSSFPWTALYSSLQQALSEWPPP